MFHVLRHRFTAITATALALVLTVTSPAAQAVTTDMHPGGVETAVGQMFHDGMSCTAVFINSRTALSARHCVHHEGARVAIHGGWNGNHGVYSGTVRVAPSNTDMVAVVLDHDYHGPTAPLATRPAFPGEQGRFVGYDVQNVPHATFTTVTKSLTGSQHPSWGGMYVETAFAAHQVRHGDSGGPLIIGGQVHGILSNGYYHVDGNSMIDGRFASTMAVAPWLAGLGAGSMSSF